VVSGYPGISFFSCDMYQCIKDVHVDSAGRGIGLVIFDSQSSVATVQLSKVAPTKNANGDLAYNAGDVVASAFSAKDYNHSVEFTGLDAGTSYYYLINAAKGPMGTDAQKTGIVTTLKRYATATINSITVMDDSDTFSDGDLAFNLRVNGAGPAIYPSADDIGFNPANGSTTEWASGASRNVDMAVKIDCGTQATVTLEGWDWDSNQQGWLNGQPIDIETETVGIGGDKATASMTIDVTGDEESATLWKPFTMQTTNASLKFKATGYVSTTYAP
jgi:hypothetical protein